MRHFLAPLTFGLILSACGSLLPPPGEPAKKYILAALPNESNGFVELKSSKSFRSHQLIVDLPTLYPPIDSSRIALKPQEQTIDYYADIEWADRLSALIQESLIYSLQNQGNLNSVSRPTEGIQADYALKVEVRKFYINEPQKPASTAEVDYMVYLVKLPERHVVASRHFIDATASQKYTLDNLVKSLNTAHLNVSRDLVAWVLQHIQ